MNVRNEIKAQIIRAGMTMQEVVDLLSDEYGWSDSVSNLSAKLQRESIRYKEVLELADVAGMRHCMAAKTGEVMPPATAPRISRPHRHTAVLPMDGSERRCQRLQETFRRTASCRRADHGKRRRHFRLGQQRSPQ